MGRSSVRDLSLKGVSILPIRSLCQTLLVITFPQLALNWRASEIASERPFNNVNNRSSFRAMSSTGHEIQSFFTSYFSEVWKCGIVWQVEFNVALSLSHEKLSALYEHLVLFLYRFLHFSLRTILILNRRYNHCFSASCWKKLKVKKPDLQLIFIPYQYASTLIIVISSHISTVS